MNALNLSAVFGILVLIFQHGNLQGLLGYHSGGALDATQPILLFAIGFGLATDYGVFLLARIKEAHDAGAPNSEAVALGLERTGRIVTAAALLFAVAIGAFATSKIVFIKELGIGTALAVLLDASIVRALLVPSLMELLGSELVGAESAAPAVRTDRATGERPPAPRNAEPSRAQPTRRAQSGGQMSYVRKSIDELSTRYGGVVRLARRDLGITAFGCQVFERPPNAGGPRHSESGTGQQELYVNLGGSGWIDVDGARVEFGPRTMIHVTTESVRQPVSGLSYAATRAGFSQRVGSGPHAWRASRSTQAQTGGTSV